MKESKENEGSKENKESKENEEQPKEMCPDLDRIGLFKEMSYLHEYVPLKISFNDASKKGKQMQTICSKTKTGNQDGYFASKFQRAFEGEAYMDRIRLNRLYRLEKAKKNLTKCFKYSSPPKKPSGKGSNYGTFEGYNKKKMEYFSSKPLDRAKSEGQKKNFYVNPPQKGTGYGYPNLTIGKLPPYFLEKEYEELKNAQKEEPKRPQPRPFLPYRAGVFKQGFFGPNPFTTDEEEESAAPKEETRETAEEKSKKDPFMPTHPAKKDGGMKAGCLNPFPTHIGEDYPRINLVSRGVKRYENAEGKMFRPVPGIRPYPVKSIINTNVKKQMNSTNFKTTKGVVYCKESRR